MLDKLNFEEDVVFDKHNLEEEWEKQPELALVYTMAEAEARKAVELLKISVEEAKDNLKRVEGAVTVEVMEDPSAYGLSKSTKDAVESVVCNNEEVEAARKAYHDKQRELVEANYNLDLVHGAVVAITTDRRQGLSNTVELWKAGYFGTPGKSGVTSQEESNTTKRSSVEKMKHHVRKR